MRNVNNYFSSNGYTITFNDRNVDDTEQAYRIIRQVGGPIAVYRVPFIPGPWDDECGVIGHRNAFDIRRDMEVCTDLEEYGHLSVELAAVTSLFVTAERMGRSVAA